MESVLMSCISLLQLSTNAYRPIITNLTEERGNFFSPYTMLSYLENVSFSLPNKPLSEMTALSLTEVSVFHISVWSHRTLKFLQKLVY